MQEIDFKTYIKKTSEKIEQELHKFSQEWNKKVSKFPELQKPNERFTESLFGGKMLRGVLVKLGYDLVQATSSEAIFKPAAACEIIHTALLIHDDIIDQSPTRRGKPSVHIMGESHYGISQAICLGDLGIIMAIESIQESNFPQEVRMKAIALFLQIIKETIVGQMLDIESSRTNARHEKEIINIDMMKTAAYSFIGPLSIGAILGGASDELLVIIKQFGEKLGIAYQIQDDILGIFGDEKILGKSVTSDIEENKNTLLFTYALIHASEKQKALLKSIYGKKNVTEEQLLIIRRLFEDTGAVRHSEKKINEYIMQARELIPQLSSEPTKRIMLLQLTDLLIKRKK